jgi:uncharacterized protein (DUF2141 family)
MPFTFREWSNGAICEPILPSHEVKDARFRAPGQNRASDQTKELSMTRTTRSLRLSASFLALALLTSGMAASLSAHAADTPDTAPVSETAAIDAAPEANIEANIEATGADAEQATTSLTLTLTGISNQKGTISVGVFFGQENYDGGEAVTGANVTVDADEETVVISGLKPGEYGLKLFHDVNGNGKMDTNPFGMPVEPFAFSNNAKGRFGPAGWDAARFTVTADGGEQTITIN